MTHEDRHRGRHPGDDRLFGPDQLPALRAAVADLSWLMSRGYADTSALKLVGDRHELTARQRQAVGRCACADAARDLRRARRLTRAQLGGRVLALDGLNCLITIESALSHGIVLRGRDSALRDLASVHGTYKQVAETAFGIEMIGRHLHGRGDMDPAQIVPEVRWYLDRPVANSGRLRALLQETAERHGWPWTIELVSNPDAVLVRQSAVVGTSDAWILDRCEHWFDLLANLLGPPASDRAPASATGPVLAARTDLWLLDLDSPPGPDSGIDGL
jgi:hypothetical protein